MFKRLNNKGVVMVMVLGTILVVVILANVILTIILNQTRLTRHQIDRIKAYYAATAAMNLTFEQLRTGAWTTGAYSLCSSGCTVNDLDIPYRIDIVISAPGTGINGTRTVTFTTNYTYQE